MMRCSRQPGKNPSACIADKSLEICQRCRLGRQAANISKPQSEIVRGANAQKHCHRSTIYSRGTGRESAVPNGIQVDLHFSSLLNRFREGSDG
jgi:hypothetical protein